jgi:hypothetical protein
MTSPLVLTSDAYVIRNGGYWLQGENGWGQRSCARIFTARQLKELQKDSPYPTATTEQA